MSMFWELLEAVINRMMVFQKLNFDPVYKNTENTMSHLYFNGESDYSEENSCENEVLRSTIERNWTDLLHAVLE